MSTPVTTHDAGAAPASDVLFRVVNRVALITLNRPAALNALSYAMIGELAALFARCRDDDRIVAVVLRGAGGKGFCAGGGRARAAPDGRAARKPGCRSSSTNTGSTTRFIRSRSLSSR